MVVGSLTLIGSGEMARSMSKVHRSVLSRVEGPVHAVFLDTPAGFELNADQISAKAVEYFAKHFDIDLEVVSFKAAASATPAEITAALHKLRSANYIFAGPGSPTYAVDNWRDTVILEAVSRRLAHGAHVVLASAAAIAVGRYALPVYEIYKAGQPPRWVEGLDLLSEYGLDVAIVPHWNNAEGGDHDTRYCFVGKPRFELLEQRLPPSTVILGVDEYTACTLDLHRAQAEVIGAGKVTLRAQGCTRRYAAGTAFDLEALSLHEKVGGPVDAPPTDAPPQSEAAYRLPPDWDAALEEGTACGAPFVELLVRVRDQLRADEAWALADEIRDRLSALGILLEDGPDETTWRRVDGSADAQ